MDQVGQKYKKNMQKIVFSLKKNMLKTLVKTTFILYKLLFRLLIKIIQMMTIYLKIVKKLFHVNQVGQKYQKSAKMCNFVKCKKLLLK